MQVEQFNYYLPEGLIAQTPLVRRDSSRLMVLHGNSNQIEHLQFKELKRFLSSGDRLVLNDTRVIPARLFGHKQGTGGSVEVMLLHPRDEAVWEVLVRPGRRIQPGVWLTFGPNGELTAEVLQRTDSGGRLIRFYSSRGTFAEALSRLGEIPLPPYIKKKLSDSERYQTVYARESGSVAAPTAGLHFTPELLHSLQSQGVNITKVTLHVGLGTFRPVQSDLVEGHTMHSEYYRITEKAAEEINNTLKSGHRLLAVGTTVCRVLETAAAGKGVVAPSSGFTKIFIYPGYRFKIVNSLLTNFHLPRSTLLMLVSALAGREKIIRAYEEAVNQQYRFFSFGDAMLIITNQ